MDFYYTSDLSPYRDLLSRKLTDLPCKHVMGLGSAKAKELYARSKELGYPQAMWGYGLGIHTEESENRIIQIQTIRRMIYKQIVRPFRVVIDSAGVPWVDNLHSCIRDILVTDSPDCTLGDTWFYLVDLSFDTPVVGDYRGSLSNNLSDILDALGAAKRRDVRTSPKIRQVGYTIGEFMEDNRICREALGLPYDAYTSFIKASHEELRQRKAERWWA